jgi:hypothetical protein
MGNKDKKARALKECADWNHAHPIGTPVELTTDSKGVIHTKTTAAAQLIPSSNLPVIWVEGISGCYLLSRVKPAGRVK